MARQEDADRAYAAADEWEQRRKVARARMVAQIGRGPLVYYGGVGEIHRCPTCPWCGEAFDAETWVLEPSIGGQSPLAALALGMAALRVNHEAVCPQCGHIAHFRPLGGEEG